VVTPEIIDISETEADSEGAPNAAKNECENENQLIATGFSRSEVQHALTEIQKRKTSSGKTLEDALNFLLSGSPSVKADENGSKAKSPLPVKNRKSQSPASLGKKRKKTQQTSLNFFAKSSPPSSSKRKS